MAKLALKVEFAGGSAAMLATLSSIGTALSMTHFLIHLAVSLPGAAQECSGSLIFFWAAVALGAILVPRAFYSAVDDVSNGLGFGKTP